jgi:hypothetical protein
LVDVLSVDISATVLAITGCSANGFVFDVAVVSVLLMARGEFSALRFSFPSLFVKSTLALRQLHSVIGRCASILSEFTLIYIEATAFAKFFISSSSELIFHHRHEESIWEKSKTPFSLES